MTSEDETLIFRALSHFLGEAEEVRRIMDELSTLMRKAARVDDISATMARAIQKKHDLLMDAKADRDKAIAALHSTTKHRIVVDEESSWPEQLPRETWNG